MYIQILNYCLIYMVDRKSMQCLSLRPIIWCAIKRNHDVPQQFKYDKVGS